MCTLITLFQSHPSAPLIFALNRDEFLERPTQGVELWNEQPPEKRIIAGRDLRSGGTWFGVGRTVAAALTNHREGGPGGGGRSRVAPLSRGDLVIKALEGESLGAVAEELARLDGEAYGGFHLFASDAREAAWITNRNGPMEVLSVAPGMHVLGNFGLDDEHDPVVANLHRELDGASAMPREELQRHLRGLLASHGPGRPCVHMGMYGTRSSAILYWGSTDGNPGNALWTSDGPPCETEWADRSELLLGLS